MTDWQTELSWRAGIFDDEPDEEDYEAAEDEWEDEEWEDEDE